MNYQQFDVKKITKKSFLTFLYQKIPLQYLIIQKKNVPLHFVMDKSQFIICRASAGSGKTYTLVRQYLLLAFSASEGELPSRFKRILAITFTNKAANEMKERILRELDNIATHGTNTPMGNDLGQRLNLNHDTLQRYANAVRQAILHNYSDLAVCTIDSFMHRIVRTFAHDLNLPMNFDVQIDNDELIQNAVEDMMALVGTEGQKELTDILCEFAEERMADGKSYMIERELTDLAEELFSEQTPQYLELLKDIDSPGFRAIHRSMVADNKAYEQRLKTLGQKAVDTFVSAGLSDADFFHGASGAGGYFRKLANGTFDNPNSYVLAYLEGEKLGSAKCPPAIRDSLAQIKPALCDIFNRIQLIRNSEEVLYNTRRLLLKNLYSLALLNKLNQLMGQYSQENEIVHISEFNHRIADVVQDEPAPFIYERIGNRYHNYLIDEFQDTSRLQWQNLVPLIENGVGSGHLSLVVGDGKQAIYRFRQGDVTQFISLPHVDNPLHGHLLEQPGISTVQQLENNFRTASVIVEFNNGFFEWAIRQRFSHNAELQSIYIGHDKTPSLLQQPVKEGGYIQVGFWDLNKKDLSPFWDEMLTDIHSLTDEKGYHLRDITVLARDNRTLAQISTHFTSHGIPVISSESFLLTQSRTVMLMRSLLQYLLDSNDRVAAAKVVLYLRSLGKTSITLDPAFLNSRQPVNLDQILAVDGFSLNCNKLLSLSLYDCCEEMLRMLNLDGIDTAYTSTFLNVVSKYSNSHRHDLSEFLEWFDKQKDRISTNTAADLDAVRLMTIHKANGLESPVILYPIFNKRDNIDNIWVQADPGSLLPLPAALVRPTKDKSTLFDRQYNDELLKTEMDNINVLYVALTRPKEKLFLYCQKPPKESTTGYTSLLSDYLSNRTDTVPVRPDVISIGSNAPAPNTDSDKSPTSTLSLHSTAFPDWESRIAIADQSASLFSQFDETAIRRGNQIHEILALIHSVNDTYAALDSYATRNHLDPDTIDALRHTLNVMMQQPEVVRFFSPDHTAKTECNIAWQGEVIRPDRIVYTPEAVYVVDYKTGQPNNDHILQVLHYCDALRAMGNPNVDGFLLYIRPDGVQVCPCP